ncbi:MAG: hypothetical protein HC915_17700 [Anaerolineae bacterium]|nr:hypothetical protein [Anaerolineae bacterium]
MEEREVVFDFLTDLWQDGEVDTTRFTPGQRVFLLREVLQRDLGDDFGDLSLEDLENLDFESLLPDLDETFDEDTNNFSDAPSTGWRDSDGDGLADWDDDCPARFGPPDRNGCPLPRPNNGSTGPLPPGGNGGSSDDGNRDDLDGDLDDDLDDDFDDDDTGQDAGSTENAAGGPRDSDGDGIFDANDACPNEPGPGDFGGCPPPPDSDGDGIADPFDACPNTPGTAADNGC